MVENSSNQSKLEQLTAFIKERRDGRELKRGLAVKLSLEKYPYHQIKSIVEVSIGFISKWKKAFLAQGVKGLTLGYKGAKPCLNPQEKAAVINWLKTQDNWNLRELRNHLSVNYQIEFKARKSYYKLFKAAKISWKKSQKKNPKKDPKKVEEKRKEITQFLQDCQKEISQGNLSVFVIDECHLNRGDICGYVWGRTDERVEVPMTNERYKQTYFGALDYQTKEFFVKPYEKAAKRKDSRVFKISPKKATRSKNCRDLGWSFLSSI